MKSAEEQIADYSAELHDGMRDVTTAETLIASHRRLRAQNQLTMQEYRAEMDAGREAGRREAVQLVTHGEYVEVSKLREMSVAQMANFLYRDDS